MGDVTHAIRVRSDELRRAPEARFDALHRQVPADDAGGANEHLLGFTPHAIRRNGCHAFRVTEPLLSRAGVGVAGTNDDAADAGGRNPLAAKLYRCGTDTILRKNTRS